MGRRGTFALVFAVAAIVAPCAHAATVSENIPFTADDGVTLTTTLTGESPMAARPTVVEFSPYGAGSQTLTVGSDYNYLLVQIRGTGESNGTFDALGPQSQSDVQQVLQWACDQSWDNGSLALNGFSASSIIIYNSLWETLPCVKAAILKSGTFDLYRDLFYPGGISNAAAGIYVLASIGGDALEDGYTRFEDGDPQSGIDTGSGILEAGLAGAENQTEDSFWQQRGFQGDVNRVPTLMIDSFYDVEELGAFDAFQALQSNPSHLLLLSGHDGTPAGTDGGQAEENEWLDHYLLGVDNGVENQPAVQMLMSNGDRETYEQGDTTQASGSSWPIPGTQWTSLYLNADRSGSSNSINDGTLSLQPASSATTLAQSFAALPSLPSATDSPNMGVIDAAGASNFDERFPYFEQMNAVEPEGLSYTSAPLSTAVHSAGPATLELNLSSTAPQTSMWAVISDVTPSGTSNPVATGRLSSDYPNIIASKSVYDSQGDVVEPYADFSTSDPAPIGTSRTYYIEFWPIGNVFKAGDRIRVDIIGASGASEPGDPAVDTVTVGGSDGSRLILPYLPGSDLPGAL
jgi:uncharacterized protein